MPNIPALLAAALVSLALVGCATPPPEADDHGLAAEDTVTGRDTVPSMELPPPLEEVRAP
ncbi:MAG TPA: hypothetical protein VMN39_06255 [Longimicrobiaceae bacterium]|nr:hypothetical protein [Longimicrobiaceae bacterium]